MGDGPLGYLSPTSDWMCTRRRSASRLPRAAATVTCARSGFREPSRASDEAGSLAEQRGSSAEFCKEAGPSGYGLHRPLTGCGHECVVVASSLIPVKAGDRVKTDRRDAVMLAKLHRAGELTSIWIPDAAHEPCATPACAGAGPGAGTGDGGPGLVQGTPASAKILAPPRSDLSRSSCLDAGYRRWLTTVRFAHPAQQIVLQDYIHAVQDAEARLERLTRQIEELLPSWSMAPVVAALQAMRGPDSCSHRRVRSRRLSTLRQCAAADGLSRLVPTEHSSGANVRRGGITKAGNVMARRVLIEELGLTACRRASAASFMTATRSCCRRSATSLGKARSGCVRAIGGLLRRASRRSWSPRQSPVRWSALSEPSAASPSRRPELTQSAYSNARRSTTGDPLGRTAGDRAAVGNPPALL